MKNPFLDRDFLKLLDEQNQKEIYAKIISFDFNDNPIEEIQGIITGGNISIDGASSSRRTCSLQIIASEVNIHEYYWGLKTKFKLYIGVTNNIDSSYEDIIWFPQGMYLISSFNTSQATNSYSISIQGADKMSLLDGTLGGTITALSVDFGKIDEIDENGVITTSDLLLKDIITEAVHTYAKEPFHNIIVNDLDDYGVELLEYRYDEPMYLVIDAKTDNVVQMTIAGEVQYYDSDGKLIALKEISNYDLRMQDLLEEVDEYNPTIVYPAPGSNIRYTVAKLEKGETAGYRITDLVYAGELILNVGETITALLTRIVEMLGDFEYFYNLDGQFVFQRKKTYTQVSFNNIARDGAGETYVQDAAFTSACTYSFENGKLISSFSNSPDYANLRNDFSIWGVRKSVTGNELPVHLRYAIDKKPLIYKTISVDVKDVEEYEKQWKVTSAGPQDSYIYSTLPLSDTEKGLNYSRGRDGLDWREVLYQMASDYNKWNHLDGFHSKVAAANGAFTSIEFEDGPKYLSDIGLGFPTGYTGYEQYYTDILGFWRQLYNPYYEGTYKVASVNKKEFEKDPTPYYWYQNGKDEEYISGVQYYIDNLQNGYTKRNNVTKAQYDLHPEQYYFIRRGNPQIVDRTYEIKAVEQTVEKTSTTNGVEETYTVIEYAPDRNYNQTINDSLASNALCIHQDGYYYNYTTSEYDGNYYIGNEVWEPKKFYIEKKFSLYQKEQEFELDSGTEYNPKQRYYSQSAVDKNIYYRVCVGNVKYLQGEFFTISLSLSADGQTYIPTPKAYIKPDIMNAVTPQRVYKKEGTQTKTLKVPVFFETTYEKDKYGAYAINETGYLTIKSQASDQYLEFFKKYRVSLFFDIKELLYPYNPSETYYTLHFDEYNGLWSESEGVKTPGDWWNKNVTLAPETLNFWFDFLDTEGDLAKYSVQNIGSRPKAENNANVKAIYFREIPNVIFYDLPTDATEDERESALEELRVQQELKTGYTFIQLPKAMENLFSISSQGQSAKDVLESMMYQHTYCTESISISSLPVYYLEPNTRIFVRDDKSGINGEYIVSNISYALGHSGTMSISAVKAATNMY